MIWSCDSTLKWKECPWQHESARLLLESLESELNAVQPPKAEWRDIGRDISESCLVRPGWNSSRGAHLWNYGALEQLEIQCLEEFASLCFPAIGWKSKEFLGKKTSTEVFCFSHFSDTTWMWHGRSELLDVWLFWPELFPRWALPNVDPCEIPVSSDNRYVWWTVFIFLDHKNYKNCQLNWNVSCEYWSMPMGMRKENTNRSFWHSHASKDILTLANDNLGC